MLEGVQIPGIAQFRLCTLSNNQLIKAVADGLIEMYTEPTKVPTRQIPARPDKDFDLLVAEMIIRFAELDEQISIQSKITNKIA